METTDGVVGQEHVEDHSEVEEVAVSVLDHEGEAGLTGVVGVSVSYGAGWWAPPKGAVVATAVVVAGHPEAQGENQDDQGGGEVADIQCEAKRVRALNARGRKTGAVEGANEFVDAGAANEVVHTLKGGPGRVNHKRSQN